MKKSSAFPNGRILKPFANMNGYLVIGLYENRHNTRYSVHRLILETFVGPRLPGCTAAHWNGEKKDNRLANLRWATHADNCADKVRHGRTNRGERSGRAILTATQVREIRASAANQVALARRYGVGRTTIQAIIYGISWKHLLQGEHDVSHQAT